MFVPKPLSLKSGALAVLFLFGLHATTSAADPKDKRAGVEFFEKRIRPVLVRECYSCHSAKAKAVKGKLLLDTRSGLRKGGESGPAIVAGKPAASLLLDALQHKTIEMPPGKKLPNNVITDFRKWIQLGAPDPRSGKSSGHPKSSTGTLWSLKPINKPAMPTVKKTDWPRGDIDRFILARLENAGLQPATDADRITLLRRVSFDLIGLPPTPDEIAAFIADKSPNAFETVVDRLLTSPHFGERWGRHWLDVARFAESNGKDRDAIYPHAWRYRRYVIAAFNADKPYDQFIREQIAGDLLPAKNDAHREQLRIATGFLAIGPKNLMQNGEQMLMETVDEQIDVTTRAVLAMTASCARCHDHKFDPIPSKDYYALAGIFHSTDTLYGAGSRGGKKAAQHEKNLLPLSGKKQFAMAVREAKKIGDTELRIRGDFRKRGPKVSRGFLSAVPVTAKLTVGSKQSGRLELARWLTHPSNPLTPRVAVNRIWQHLFGRGIVRTVDNFGVNGEDPTHPELLDHLATRFIADGWSFKKTIRAIVLSRTYQMAATFNEKNASQDPDNTLLWRHSPRRLDAEALRDAMLAASGTLDRKPPERSPVAEVGYGEVGRGINTKPLERPFPHRSVYLPVFRTQLPEELRVFDFAEPSIVVGQRSETTIPTQVLYFMNSDFVIDNAEATARRVLKSPANDDALRIDAAYRLCLSRPATKAEFERGRAFLKLADKRLTATQPDAARRRQAVWAMFCQALFASAEFRYVN